MSTSTTNTAYASPPPPSNGQYPMMNGLMPPTTTAMPTTQQQQQQPSLAPPQLQQQQILQQKQQMQQQQHTASLPQPPMFNNNMNMSKFLPPNVALSPMASSTPNTTMSPNNLNLNGPMSNMPAAKPPMPTMPANNNIPTHLRPPGMIPPYSTATTTSASTTLTNGSNGVASAQSSRTGSPALPPTTQQQQQQQQRFGAPPPSTPNANTPAAAGANMQQSLSNSMQNLNLQRSNGPPQTTTAATGANFQQQQQQRPTWNTNIASQAKVPPTVPGGGMPQTNFKTSALNAPDVVPTPTNRMPPMPAQGANMFAGQQPPKGPTTAPFASQQATSVAPPPTSAAQQPPASAAPTNRMPFSAQQPPSSMFTTAGNPLSKPPPAQGISAATGGAFMPPTSSTAPLTQQPQAPPPVGITQQKRLYPQQPTQMPPMSAASGMSQQQQPQQQQQQYPYAPAYHQQHQQQQPPAPPTQQQQQQQQQQFTSAPRSMFNGQPSSGPLQYQNQMPPMQQQQQQQYAPTLPGQQQQPLNVVQQGFSRLWGQDTIDLMQNRHILTPATIAPPKVVLHNQFHESINCNPSIMRCTIAKIPESNSLLQKSRLPLGILIHPFRDINSLPVIQCPNIVRCRLCRTYINPFVYFVDSKMWKCNLCYRVNELPDDFQFDPATKTYGDVTRRPEVRSSTIEFIAPSEYMLRPPQPAIYLFLFDVSIIAQQCGYLENVCAMLSNHLDDMPGDARTQVGFIAYNSNVHFYSMADGYNQPHEMTLLDVDDVFLPRPDNLLVNLKECKELVKDLLAQLPKRFADTHDPGSALGAALQVAYKLMQASGGRVTVFQTCLPNKGPGSLEPREDPNNRSAKDVAHLNPATDFYKRYALECSGYQIAVDLFLLNQQYSDMATISGISKHSGGCVHHFPLYQKTKQQHVDAVKNCFKRYLTRKIGFEAVMRIRCTRGLQVHTFHGNFFVRSTDLLSLPNVNPDAGFGMQIAYEESLTDVKTICFQAALLYTNSEGERRIRVHTLCLPVTASLPEVMHAADTEAIIGLLTKMAVDRSVTSNIADAREAFMNATVDILNAFKLAQNLPSGQTGQLIAPRSLALMPLYILALLKHPAFRVGTSTRLDDRVFAMDCMKTLPLDQLMKFVYPEFYNIDVLFYSAQTASNTDDDEDDELPDVPRLQLSAEFLDSRSMFLLDCGNLIILYVGLNVPVQILENVLGIKSTAELPDYCYSLPNLNTSESDALKHFIRRLNDEKPYQPIVQIIRDTSTAKPQFIEKLVDDRSESSLSYYEFLQHIRTQVK